MNLKPGAWLSQQRYLQRSESLDAQKEKRLESLGVTWNDQQQEIEVERFDRNFDLLVAFQEREGHVRVPINHQESDNDNLGDWLRYQRFRYRHGLLELDRQTISAAASRIGSANVARGSRCRMENSG
jgi:hypothetical protein